MYRTFWILLAPILMMGCVGMKKYKSLLVEHKQAQLAKDQVNAENELLNSRNNEANEELIRQNTLMSELINDKMKLQGEVQDLKQRIDLLGTESKSMETDLMNELQEKNKNLVAKEAKLNGMINWYLRQEAAFLDISAKLGEQMTGLSNEQIDWHIVDNELNIVLSHEFLTRHSSTLTGDGKLALDKLGLILKDYPSFGVSVVGHTDNSLSSVRSALEISSRRASLIGAYLTDQGFVNGNQISVSGRGAYQPAVSNQTSAGRALNNRIEIRLRPPLKQLYLFLEDDD